jgi:hypothetical protein
MQHRIARVEEARELVAVVACRQMEDISWRRSVHRIAASGCATAGVRAGAHDWRRTEEEKEDAVRSRMRDGEDSTARGGNVEAMVSTMATKDGSIHRDSEGRAQVPRTAQLARAHEEWHHWSTALYGC